MEVLEQPSAMLDGHSSTRARSYVIWQQKWMPALTSWQLCLPYRGITLEWAPSPHTGISKEGAYWCEVYSDLQATSRKHVAVAHNPRHVQAGTSCPIVTVIAQDPTRAKIEIEAL